MTPEKTPPAKRILEPVPAYEPGWVYRAYSIPADVVQGEHSYSTSRETIEMYRDLFVSKPPESQR